MGIWKLTSPLSILADILSKNIDASVLTNLPNIIGNALSAMGSQINTFFTSTLPNAFMQMVNYFAGLWNDLGKRLTGGGDDQQGWW
jgi:hypothetical protein